MVRSLSRINTKFRDKIIIIIIISIKMVTKKHCIAIFMSILAIVAIIIVCIMSFTTNDIGATCDRVDDKKLETRIMSDETKIKEEFEVLKRSNEFMRNQKSIKEDILKIKRQENKEASDYIGGMHGKELSVCRDSVSTYSPDTDNPLPVDLDEINTYSMLLSRERLIEKKLSNSLKKLEFEIKNAIYVGCCINKIAVSNGYKHTSLSMVDCEYFTHSGKIDIMHGIPNFATETQRELDGFFPF